MAIDADTTVDDIVENPRKFGLPSFQDYCKDRDKWRKKFYGGLENTFETVDKGSENLKRHPIDMRFSFKGFTFDTLEAVQQACINEGVDFLDLAFMPRTVDMTANKVKIIVDFVEKKKSDIIEDPGWSLQERWKKLTNLLKLPFKP